MSQPSLNASQSPRPIETLEERTLFSAFEAHINFQPANSPSHPGYVIDAGHPFRARNGFRYGWNAPNPSLFDRNNKRSPDQRYDTLADFNAGKKSLTWELQLPNGLYQLHLVAGDPTEFNNVIKLKAEGKSVLAGTTTKKHRWLESTTVVEVKDGRLTLAGAKGAVRNRVAFLDVVAVRRAPTTLQAEKADTFRGVVATKTAVTDLDPGDHLVFKNLLFDGSFHSIQTRLAVNEDQAGQVIEFRLDSPKGRLVGSVQTEGAGDVNATRVQSTSLSRVTGVHDLYVVFKRNPDAPSTPAEVGAIDSFRFSTRPVVRIMPLGDSITEATGGHDSYRWKLWRLLEAAGYSVDFVGPNSGVYPGEGDPVHEDFDQDHAGYGGYRADEILHGDTRIPGGIDSLAQDYPADVVLIHLGTNDLFANQLNKDTAVEVRLIIERLRAANPNVKVLLAKILPTDLYNTTRAEVEDLNARYEALAKELSTKKSPVLLVDQYTGVNLDTDTYDRAHPTPEHEAEMGRRWFDVLKTVL